MRVWLPPLCPPHAGERTQEPKRRRMLPRSTKEKSSMLRRLAAALALLAAFALEAHAAAYPTRPVTLVVAFTPGGPSDVLARIVGQQLEKVLGQPFVIENRP